MGNRDKGVVAGCTALPDVEAAGAIWAIETKGVGRRLQTYATGCKGGRRDMGNRD